MWEAESAGRSAKNPVKGRRRMSPDERSQRTHMPDDPQQWPDPRAFVTSSVRHVSVALVIALAFLLGIVLGLVIAS